MITSLLKGHDNEIRGAVVRSSNGSELRRPLTKLYPIEYVSKLKDNNTVILPKVIEEENRVRPKRNAAVIGELKRRFQDKQFENE